MTAVRCFIIFLISLVTSIGAKAQFSEEYLKYKTMYPNENKVCLSTTTNFNISIVGAELKIEEVFSEENLYLGSNANLFSEDEISYSSFFDLKDLKASSMNFVNGKYKEIPVKNFTHKDNLSTGVFHDDSKMVKFLYPKLEEGAKSKVYYIYSVKNPYILAKSFFSFSYPTAVSNYIITADEGVEIAFNTFNTDSINLKYSTEVKGGKKIYKWTATDVKGIKQETNSVGYNYYLPHIIPRIVSYKYKNKKIDVLNNIKDLHAWYYLLTKNINQEKPEDKLVDLVSSLVNDKNTEFEKVKALYYWVQQNIKYVAFEYELGGYIPREANDIFNKKYGDCKDNANLLKKMLELAGIKSYLTWIGTRDLPYTYTEVPSPANDNHMILTYFADSIPYFLDATGRFNPIEIPSSFIQGKEALISLDSTHYLIKKVPIINAQQNYITDSVELKIQNQNLIGNALIKMNNYQKMDYFNFLEKITSSADLLDFYNLNFKKGNNKFLIKDFTESNKYSYDNEFTISYSFNIDNYILS